jgi:hypothetical protein
VIDRYYVEQLATQRDMDQDVFYTDDPFATIEEARAFVTVADPYLEHYIYKCSDNLLTQVEYKAYGDMWRPVEENK